MPKKIDIIITEEVSVLKKLFLKTKSPLKRDRIEALLFIKRDNYVYLLDIANKLNRTEKTIRTWLNEYRHNGLTGLLEVKSGGNNTRTLSDKVLSLISEKLNDSNTTITSYVELKAIIEEESGENITYGALHTHCTRKHKSKLKVSRKSHHKKDPNAEAFFKKPIHKV